jgi:hypothetical protein
MEGLDRHERQAASLLNCAGLFDLNQTATETKKRGEYCSPQGRGQAWDAWERRAQRLQPVRKSVPRRLRLGYATLCEICKFQSKIAGVGCIAQRDFEIDDAGADHSV